MKKLICLVTCLFSFSLTYANNLPVDSKAPDFKLVDVQGREVQLDKLKGKWVVLEWFNKGCPFVKKHYDSNNMQSLQKKYIDKGVKWITIISSAEGKQGHESDRETIETAKTLKASPTHILRDTDGKIGQTYIAKTTPHMFIISPEQKIVYQGAIDDNSSSDPAVIPASKNYLSLALDEALQGKPVTVKKSKPYGCSVKY